MLYELQIAVSPRPVKGNLTRDKTGQVWRRSMRYRSEADALKSGAKNYPGVMFRVVSIRPESPLRDSPRKA